MSTSRAARIAELTSDLAATRLAIRNIIAGGQAYSAEGRMMTRADLAVLRTIEKEQAEELARITRGTRGRTYGVIYR